MSNNQNLKIAACLLATTAAWGCTTFPTESSGRDAVTEHVGVYSSAPRVNVKPTVGVPPFKIERGELNYGQFATVAADQLTTLAQRTGRFRMIERAQLDQLLDEQELEGIVEAGELARMARVHGVDLLLLGKIDDFRMKRERAQTGIGGRVPAMFGGLGGKKASYQSDAYRITVECGVDLRLVDPETGEIVVAHFSQYKKMDTAGGFGIRLDDVQASSGNDVAISQDSQGKLLRLALDDAVRRMLPDIDDYMLARPVPATASVEESSGNDPAGATAGFCTECGEKRAAGDAFCKSCGNKAK